jgi:hypothetical protein
MLDTKPNKAGPRAAAKELAEIRTRRDAMLKSLSESTDEEERDCLRRGLGLVEACLAALESQASQPCFERR